jgi:thioredoxin-like negative regulator of GroEL
MTTLILAAVLNATIAAGAETYADAHRETSKTGKPLVVMVSTEWCVPCQQMKQTVIPQVRKHGLLSKVSFAVVNPDQDAELANRLTGGGPIPQLVMYRKTRQGWLRRKLIGGQTVEAVEQFIDDGLASQSSDKNKGKEESQAETTTNSDESTKHTMSDESTEKASTKG